MKSKNLTILILSIFGALRLFAADESGTDEVAPSFGRYDGSAENVALVKILVNPSAFLGKKVRVVGVYHHDFEASYLFLSRDSLEGYDVESAIKLPVDPVQLPGPEAGIERMNGCVVAIEGTLYKTSDRFGDRLGLRNMNRIYYKGGKLQDKRVSITQPNNGETPRVK